MKLNSQQRKEMVGKRYAKYSVDDYATVHDVERCAGGFTVKFTYQQKGDLEYMGLQKFLKKYPHEIYHPIR